MRILHTSDWHLGISTGPVSRLEEQAAFLDWLGRVLAEREVDALIVAGDIFDSMHPSAEAQALYFRFLAGVGGTGVRSVVVVGGNHDSASGLDAPRALLEAVDVTVVGGVPVEERRVERMLVPLRLRGSADDDPPAAICLAMPYVHEYRLGVRTTDLDLEGTRAAFRQAFGALYTQLADAAVAQFGDLPLVATGHLTLGANVRREDYPQEIHQVGSIDALPSSILDARIRYAALGHIHRSLPVDKPRAWYSGSPIPYATTEMSARRQVLLVEIEGEAAPTVEPLPVPQQRDLVELLGTPDDVVERLAKLTWETQLPPLVHARVQVEAPESSLVQKLNDALLEHDEDRRPILVEVQQRALAPPTDTQAKTTPVLDELEPRQVFEMLCEARGHVGETRAALLRAFAQIESADPAALDEMVADVHRAAVENVEAS
ncbi:MAG: exonuclease subunit SbcD [Deltaproteobacteria bacterium]|nr:exonuclease subunit SbcD [Deltaproteobacteria bacterium]